MLPRVGRRLAAEWRGVGGEPDVAAHSWEQSAPARLGSNVGSPRPPGLGCPFVSPRLWPSGSGRRPHPTVAVQSPGAKESHPHAPTRAPPNFPKLGPPPRDSKPPKCRLSICSDGPGFRKPGSRPQARGPEERPTTAPPHRDSLSGPRRSRRQARAYLVGSLRRPIRVRPRSRPSALSEPRSGPPTARRPPSNPGAAGS